jgi:RimJ/RimL family protein N-acetyltransferase
VTDGRAFPLIRAVLEGSQPGQVFTEGVPGSPRAFVITRFGFAQWLGDEDGGELDRTVQGLLRGEDSRLARYWLWYAPPPGWQRRLDAVAAGRVRRRERCRLALRDPRPADPATAPGIELRLLDERLVAEASSLGLDLGSRFWPSERAFLEGGFGVCALEAGQVACVCYAAGVAGGQAEVDVLTRPEYRGRGLARAVAGRFVEECLVRGIRPTWDCFRENAASMRLAAALGFVLERTYWLYSFTIPLDLPGAIEGPPG